MCVVGKDLKKGIYSHQAAQEILFFFPARWGHHRLANTGVTPFAFSRNTPHSNLHQGFSISPPYTVLHPFWIKWALVFCFPNQISWIQPKWPSRARASAGPEGFKHAGFSKGETDTQSGHAKFRKLRKTLLLLWELMGKEQGKGKKKTKPNINP